MRILAYSAFVIVEFVLPLAAIGAFIATILLWSAIASGQG